MAKDDYRDSEEVENKNEKYEAETELTRGEGKGGEMRRWMYLEGKREKLGGTTRG